MPGSFSPISSLFLVFAVAACAPVTEENVIVTETIGADQDIAGMGEGGPDGGEPGLADVELCEAEAFRPLIGTSIAATALPEDPLLRAFGENDIVTQDYRPERTNILFDAGGTIIRVYCG